MFGSSIEKQKKKLANKYQQLLSESYRLSHTNRKKSDEKAAEADKIRKQIDAIEETNQ